MELISVYIFCGRKHLLNCDLFQACRTYIYPHYKFCFSIYNFGIFDINIFQICLFIFTARYKIMDLHHSFKYLFVKKHNYIIIEQEMPKTFIFLYINLS